MLLSRRPPRRSGWITVEFAFMVTFILTPLLLGTWEVGRMIQVQQIVNNSAREGARLAAQGFTINNLGSSTQIKVSSGTPNVTDTVYNYLYAAGLTNLQKGDVTVTFTYLDGSANTEPYQGKKGQPFAVSVTIPWAKVRWVNLGLVGPTTVYGTVTWQMVVDDPFTVNDTLPPW
jgi:Flp pilus assembly protein TadG